jgi:membrane-associated tyrosine/threonine-specific cdc2-inhibitory kinase
LLIENVGRELLQVWRYIEQVAAGLDHIHNHGVLHLDIKPENIFVDGKGDLKIGDFGLAVPRKLWEWEEGDGAYVAPELLQEKEPGPEADMYSFGAMVYEWATGSKLPRSGPAREGQVEMPLSISEQLGNLVCSLLNPNPAQRPSASKVLAWQKAE